MSDIDFDVVIIGAGISGIGAAYYLQQDCPRKSYVILEGREALGGTWDLFRYPGIRSDSSMLTMSYSFKPWKGTSGTAPGPSILNYVKEVAAENKIEPHIRYGQKVTQAIWDTNEARWTVHSATGEQFSCHFLLMCAGYYSYSSGYTPDFPGQKRFQGDIIHPQNWPEGLDYRKKHIIVIGSGATAVTLVPELAKKAAHVTMLQRSPTYMQPAPSEDEFGLTIRKMLPDWLAYRILRRRSIRFGHDFYQQTRLAPSVVKEMMIDVVREELPADYDIDTHFTPAYFPWDQRLCLVPDGDLFAAIRAGTAAIETDHIECFTEAGILLKSGKCLQADIIISATGLNLEVLGGIEYIVDGHAVNFAKTVTYKGMMCSNVPNMVMMFGYINASWTLGVDLTAAYVTRLLRHMDKIGATHCVPRLETPEKVGTQPWIRDFSSGYMQRSMHLMPRQGEARPWVNTQSYLEDKELIEKAPVSDGVLHFESQK